VAALKHNNSLYLVKFYCQMFWIMYKEPRYQKKKSFCLQYFDYFTLPMYPNHIKRRYEILKVLYITFLWCPCQPDGSLYMSHSMSVKLLTYTLNYKRWWLLFQWNNITLPTPTWTTEYIHKAIQYSYIAAEYREVSIHSINYLRPQNLITLLGRCKLYLLTVIK